MYFYLEIIFIESPLIPGRLSNHSKSKNYCLDIRESLSIPINQPRLFVIELL